MIDTSYRSKEIEIMDDFEMTGETLTKTLNQIAKINHLLGGNAVTVNGVKKLLKNQTKNTTITIIDLGCGNGDLLRIIADYGKKNGHTFKLIGIDANLHTINYAKSLSVNYPEIDYKQLDVLSPDFKELSCDIILCTLFLHHFSNNEIENLLTNSLNNAKLGIVINDLHRHKMAYYLFKLVCLTIKNPMVKNDGLISILRGFKKHDLNYFAKKLSCKSTITWKWAFRYQWILKNTKV